MKLSDQLRRLDDWSMAYIGPAFVGASAVVAAALCVAYRSWSPLGVVAGPFLGCAIVGVIVARRNRRRGRR